MNKKWITGIIIGLAVALIAINLYKTYQADQKVKALEEANTVNLEPTEVDETEAEMEMAPDFTLQTADGKTVQLSDYRGKKVILNFWATWCPPCKAEMPHMQKFHEENKDIEILAVNLTTLDKGSEALDKFIMDYGLTFTIPLDADGTVGNQYEAFTIPTSYIIDTEGRISNKIVGPMDEEMMGNLTKDIP
nr:TlpA disulfide reductase family protein [Exiguobacterium flavidum]